MTAPPRAEDGWETVAAGHYLRCFLEAFGDQTSEVTFRTHRSRDGELVTIMTLTVPPLSAKEIFGMEMAALDRVPHEFAGRIVMEYVSPGEENPARKGR